MSNSFEALKSTLDTSFSKLPKTPNVYDEIVWKDPPGKIGKVKAKADKGKANDYLYDGKSFSLDNYLSMLHESSHKSGLGRFPASLLMRRPKPDDKDAKDNVTQKSISVND